MIVTCDGGEQHNQLGGKVVQAVIYTVPTAAAV